MRYSIFLARLLGLYQVIMSIGMFFHLKQYQNLMTQLTQNPLVLLVMGMFTLFLGLTIILSHSKFRGWPIIITLIGYLVAIKGIVLLFFPELVQKVISQWLAFDDYITVISPLLVGIILMIFGFIVKRK